MNKQEYLYELEKALKTARVSDNEDIIGEYAEHFDMKSADGYSEEEIAARLAPPAEIAAQFADSQSGGGGRQGAKGIRAVLTAGLSIGDIFIGALFIMLYAWVITLAAFTVSSGITGIVLAAGVKTGGYIHIPEMPYHCSLPFGAAFLALTVISAVGTEYCRLYVTQLLRAYISWHKRVLAQGGHMSPPARKHPKLSAKKRRFMRNSVLIALVVFVVMFAAAYILMFISAGSPEPWHVWHWFE